MTLKEKTYLESELKKEYLTNKNAFVCIDEITYDYIDVIPFVILKGRFGIYKKGGDNNHQYDFNICYEGEKSIDYIKGLFANEIAWRENKGETKNE